MSKSSTYTAWSVALLATGIAWYILRRGRQSNTPSLITNENTDMLTTDPKLPRGYRNNNPLNIRKSNTSWKGKINPSGDAAFEQFQTMAYGYRAALVTMRTYIKKYGLNTVEKIINRWAPPSENNTLSYIKHVCDIVDLTPDTIVNLNDKDTLTKMAYAMSIIENGNTETTRLYGLPNMDTINEAWRLI